MPLSVFKKLGIGEVRPTTITLQLADRSLAYPKGKIEDILVKVDKFIYPADFLVLDYEADKDVPIILGRPFLATGRTLIDAPKGEDISEEDLIEVIKAFEQLDFKDRPTQVPSIIKAPDLELKLLPNHLKYAYLMEEEKLPLITSSNLSCEQEVKLIELLTNHKKAIGWTIADIKEISPSLCQHKIILEDNRVGKVQPQRRLNPIMKEVVKKEILNWLEAAFETIKAALVSAPIVIALDWAMPFKVMCDASDWLVGAVLGQRRNKIFHPIYYASKTLIEAQINYTTTKKELLAVVFAFDRFRSYLIGTKVIVHTDHSAIKYLFNKTDAKPQLIRWVLLLQEFDLEIIDRKGVDNQVVDHLSRIENHVSSGGDHEIKKVFPDEQILAIQHHFENNVPWYADIAHYLASGIKTYHMRGQQFKKFIHDWH
ncbi:hypothetical protein L6452_01562 [Arctium lappa]|uniref:Uncharacterized protein n=1 Tax=Arctium lappa TaxID=4217 RepID=A0ACB9FGN2_ARCLA|nr:hypothetical protein L6452_01562 [Arctium lappa]